MAQSVDTKRLSILALAFVEALNMQAEANPLLMHDLELELESAVESAHDKIPEPNMKDCVDLREALAHDDIVIAESAAIAALKVMSVAEVHNILPRKIRKEITTENSDAFISMHAKSLAKIFSPAP